MAPMLFLASGCQMMVYWYLGTIRAELSLGMSSNSMANLLTNRKYNQAFRESLGILEVPLPWSTEEAEYTSLSRSEVGVNGDLPTKQIQLQAGVRAFTSQMMVILST